MGKKKKYERKMSKVVYILFLIILLFVGIYLQNDKSEVEAINKVVEVSSELKIYYLNVGEADCILIQNGGKNMIIDAGNNEDGNEIVEFLKAQAIEKIDVLVGTHPHEDHIGGLDNIINNFDIGKIYMPKVATTTKSFEDVIKAIESKGLNITTPVIGKTFKLGECNFKILHTDDNEENLNNSSIVLKMEFGRLSYLFTGDVEADGEKAIIDSGYDIKANVLKVAHHGSNSSSTEEFLDKVAPDIAVIMCGKNNDYWHPHQVILNRLNARKIKIYRTYEDGTILITSDGYTNRVKTLKDIYLNVEKEKN
ncbi:MAG: MBL fold metallo-hydrolase [Clostridia bacterium]|nr:MBL fold metallo-hydrolase [Clostridia bacterium]